MLDVYAGSIIVVKFNGAISACRYTYMYQYTCYTGCGYAVILLL